MDTDEQLQALLAQIQAETADNAVIHLYLPPVTYTQEVSFSGRRFYLYGAIEGDARTTFAAPVTVDSGQIGRTAFQNLDFSGSGGVGLTAYSGLMLFNCRFSGWDTGILAGEGSWVTPNDCVLEGNGTGLEFRSGISSFSSPDFFNNQFVGNGTGLLLTQVPNRNTLDLSGCLFRDNGTDIANPSGQPVNTDNAAFG